MTCDEVTAWLMVISFLSGMLMQYCFEGLAIAWLVKKGKIDGFSEECPAAGKATADEKEQC